MSLFTRAIFFKNGECLTITEQECEAVKFRLLAGDKFVEVQGNLISADTVARVGEHSATARMKKTEQATIENELLLSGREDIVLARKEKEKEIAIENIAKEKTLVGKEYEDWLNKQAVTPKLNSTQSDEEIMRGDAAYYLDAVTGEKLYS